MRRREFLAAGAAGTAFLFPAVWAEKPVTTEAPTTIEEIAREYERATGGHAGIYAQNIATGQSIAWRANERFLMCSTFKASLVAFTLLRCDQRQESLNHSVDYKAADIGDLYAPFAKSNLGRGKMSVAELCQGAIEQSDNFCANKLLACSGGALALTEFWRQIGDYESRLDAIEPFLNETRYGGIENTTTPASMARNLQKVVLGGVLSETSKQQLATWLKGCRTGQNRIRAGLPENWVIGDKTGTNGANAAGDIAVIWPRPDKAITLSIYVWGGSPTADQMTALFSKAARLVAKNIA
ncbi:beta-lactamase class A [Zymomonas mobilis]|uniref:Beta-lactamase n=1 Tax=Zymomonas mobilis TaxID=542 RepID=A0A542VZ02_ZYMMB|nr:class A beta-lactamase [Zymomonas mobilis]TQL16552.1 beta-lactamase class A [Zymomonas mobilis]